MTEILDWDFTSPFVKFEDPPDFESVSPVTSLVGALVPPWSELVTALDGILKTLSNKEQIRVFRLINKLSYN